MGNWDDGTGDTRDLGRAAAGAKADAEGQDPSPPGAQEAPSAPDALAHTREPEPIVRNTPNLLDHTYTADPDRAGLLDDADMDTDLPATELPVRDPSRYRIEGERARGGLGRVLLARDRELGRTLVIKEMLRAGTTDERRFLREARVTAALEHPSIVPVHDAGRWPSGKPFYSMRLIEGRTLKELIAEKQTLEERLSLLPHVLAVAEAVAYAHSKRIIHRDLKPSNVIVGEYGETVVIDWGLAKNVAIERGRESAETPYRSPQDANVTVAGTIVGTPGYMAPEQAAGSGDIDERADVYALGAILHHVVFATPPAPQAAPEREAKPKRLRGQARSIPAELATLVAKATERDRERRYGSAKQLADDLRRFLSGHLVRAHTYTRSELVIRWIRRNRLAVAVGAASLAALILLSALFLRGLVNERDEANHQREVALARTNDLLLVQARTSLDRDPTESLHWLRQYAGDDTALLQDIAADAIARGTSLSTHRLFKVPILETMLLPGSQELLVLSSRGQVKAFDLRTGRVRALPIAADEGGLLMPLDDIRVLYSQQNEVFVHDLADKTVTVLGESPGGLISLSGENGHVVVSTETHTKIWDWNMREWVRIGPGSAATAITRDGGFVAACDRDHHLTVWNLQELSKRKTDWLRGRCNRKSMVPIAFSPSGRYLAVAEETGIIDLWNLQTRNLRTVHADSDGVAQLQFSENDRVLVSAGWGESAKVWDVAALRLVTTHTHLSQVRALATSADAVVATGAEDGRVRITHLPTGDSWDLTGHRAAVAEIVFAGNEMIATTDSTGFLRTWAFPGPRQHLQVASRAQKATVYRVQYLSEHEISTSEKDGVIRLRDLRTGGIRPYTGHSVFPYSLVWSRGHRRHLISGGIDGEVRLWDLSSGASRLLGKHESLIRDVDLSWDQRWAASASTDSTIGLWGLNGDKGRVLRGHTDAVFYARFVGRSDRLISTSVDGTVRLWHAASGTGQVILDAGAPMTAFACANECTAVAVATRTGRVFYAEAVLRGSFEELPRHGDNVRSLALSHDGHLLAAANELGDVVVTAVGDRPSLDVARFVAHDAQIVSLAFSPQARYLAGGGDNGTLRVWSMRDKSLTVLPGHTGRTWDVNFSPSGQTLTSVGTDGYVRVWRMSAWETRQTRVPPDLRDFQNWVRAKLTRVDPESLSRQ